MTELRAISLELQEEFNLYCSLENIQNQTSFDTLVQLTNDDYTQNTIETIVVEEAIIYSSTLIDGYLRGRYNLPLDTPACLPALNGVTDESSSLPSSSLCRQAAFPLLKIIAVDLCVYRLYSRRTTNEIPQTIFDNYKNAIKTLEGIRRGIIKLTDEESTTIKESPVYRVNKSSTDSMFTGDKLHVY